MSTEKILFVDDEPAVLDTLKRNLRNRFQISTALSGEEALSRLSKQGPFSVIVSDFRMPGMDGITLLQKVKKAQPDIVRIMLTGNADLSTAIDAVNNGSIFRFLTKPCPVNILIATIERALYQFQLVVAERELLHNTLRGSISMMAELLSLANPLAFSSGYRIKGTVRQIAEKLELRPLWQYEVSALLCRVGCIAIPADILSKVYNGDNLSDREHTIFSDHPRIGANLVRRIPRLENVADIIEEQLCDYDAFRSAGRENSAISLGAQVLHACLDHDQLVVAGNEDSVAFGLMYAKKGSYHPDVLFLLKSLTRTGIRQGSLMQLRFDELVPGMIAAQDIMAQNGSLIIAKGQEITWPVLQGLQNFIDHIGIKEPFAVWT